jgi:hypothetical protein
MESKIGRFPSGYAGAQLFFAIRYRGIMSFMGICSIHTSWGFRRRCLRSEHPWHRERACSAFVGKRLSECVFYLYMEVRDEGAVVLHEYGGPEKLEYKR